MKQGDPFNADLSVTFDCYEGQLRSTLSIAAIESMCELHDGPWFNG